MDKNPISSGLGVIATKKKPRKSRPPRYIRNGLAQVLPGPQLPISNPNPPKNGGNSNFNRKVIIIKNLKEGRDAVKDLLNSDIVALDCEGVTLGLRGTITLIQIGLSNIVYLFDVQQCPKLIEEVGVILESEDILKLIHDCRCDRVNLKTQYGVSLRNVWDTQIAFSETRAKKSKREGGKRIIRMGFNELCKFYGVQGNQEKENVCAELRADPRFWTRRPLTSQMLEYAASDVIFLFVLYRRMLKRITDPVKFKFICNTPDPKKEGGQSQGQGGIQQKRGVSLGDAEYETEEEFDNLSMASSNLTEKSSTPNTHKIQLAHSSTSSGGFKQNSIISIKKGKNKAPHVQVKISPSKSKLNGVSLTKTNLRSNNNVVVSNPSLYDRKPSNIHVFGSGGGCGGGNTGASSDANEFVAIANSSIFQSMFNPSFSGLNFNQNPASLPPAPLSSFIPGLISPAVTPIIIPAQSSSSNNSHLFPSPPHIKNVPLLPPAPALKDNEKIKNVMSAIEKMKITPPQVISGPPVQNNPSKMNNIEEEEEKAWGNLPRNEISVEEEFIRKLFDLTEPEMNILNESKGRKKKRMVKMIRDKIEMLENILEKGGCGSNSSADAGGQTVTVQKDGLEILEKTTINPNSAESGKRVKNNEAQTVSTGAINFFEVFPG